MRSMQCTKARVRHKKEKRKYSLLDIQPHSPAAAAAAAAQPPPSRDIVALSLHRCARKIPVLVNVKYLFIYVCLLVFFPSHNYARSSFRSPSYYY